MGYPGLAQDENCFISVQCQSSCCHYLWYTIVPDLKKSYHQICSRTPTTASGALFAIYSQGISRGGNDNKCKTCIAASGNAYTIQ